MTDTTNHPTSVSTEPQGPDENRQSDTTDAEKLTSSTEPVDHNSINQSGASEENDTPKTSSVSTIPNPPGRFLLGVVVAMVVSLPLCVLLSYAASLPFYLGLFFFMLFGLLIGATAFRVSHKHGPFGRRTVLLGTTVLVLGSWSLTIVKEAQDFPTDKAHVASQSSRDLGDYTRVEYEAMVAGEIRTYIKDRYPPGGTIGYIRWIFSEGEIKRGQIADVQRSFQPRQRRWSWAIRVVLSILLFSLGIGSQTFGLRVAKPSPA